MDVRDLRRPDLLHLGGDFQPVPVTDTFGPKYAAANASCLYTAKGTAALLVPFANVLQGATGGWGTVFIVAGVSNMLVALLAVAVLRPLRRRIVAAAEPRASVAMT